MKSTGSTEAVTMSGLTHPISTFSDPAGRTDRNRLLDSINSFMRKLWDIFRTNWQQQQRANIAMNEGKALCRMEETLRNTLGYEFDLQISGKRNECTDILQLTLKHTTTIPAEQYWQIICTLNQINERYGTLLRLRFEDDQLHDVTDTH